MTEVAALKTALTEAEDKAAKEHAACEKHEARVSEVQQELQDLESLSLQRLLRVPKPLRPKPTRPSRRLRW